MEIYLDTANLVEIREASSWNVLDGVTTNPTSIARAGKPLTKHIEAICDVVSGPVSVEVMGRDADSMVTEAKTLSQIAPNIAIKVPAVVEGLKAIGQLHELGIPVNATMVFSTNQALLVAKAGATYVSALMGRTDDVGGDGVGLIADMVSVFENYALDAKVLAASIRHPRHVLEAARVGAHIATMPFATLEKLIEHPQTHEGLERFYQDWEQYQQQS